MHATTTLLSLLALSTSVLSYGITFYQKDHRGGEALTHEGRKEGECYNIYKQGFNDNIGSIYWPDDKQCIFWYDWDCKGYHTSAWDFSMQDSGEWKNKISAYTCCPDGRWCAGLSPK